MTGPIARIIARYIVGALVAYGAFGVDDAALIEPEIVLIVATISGAAIEAFYAYARRKGWAT